MNLGELRNIKHIQEFNVGHVDEEGRSWRIVKVQGSAHIITPERLSVQLPIYANASSFSQRQSGSSTSVG